MSTLITPNSKPDAHAAPLTPDEAGHAVAALNKPGLLKFPKVERGYADPPIMNQQVGLISFVPAEGATPNKYGIFGMAKLRGNFATADEAQIKAEHIIRNVDSAHTIHHTYVGRPFPITTSSEFSETVEEIDLKEVVSEINKQEKQRKLDEERKIASEMKDRAAELVALSEQNRADLKEYHAKKADHEISTQKGEHKDVVVRNLDDYCTLRAKTAQLTWSIVEYKRLEKEARDALTAARIEVIKADRANPSFAKENYDRFVEAQTHVNHKDTEEEKQMNFIRYLVEDEMEDGKPLCYVDPSTV